LAINRLWIFMDASNIGASLKRSRWRRSIRIILALAIIAGVTVGVRLFTRNSQPAGNAGSPVASSVPVTAATATREDVPEIIDAVGNVQSIDSVSVLPRVTGVIQKIEFTPGQDVKQGQELFLIDPRPYQAALDQAKGQLAHDQGLLAEAQMDLQRYQTLESQKAINAQQAQDQVYVVQQDKGTIELDQANVETAQLNLDYCHRADLRPRGHAAGGPWQPRRTERAGEQLGKSNLDNASVDRFQLDVLSRALGFDRSVAPDLRELQCSADDVA
jgi:multidrug efflux pump subunit AcrA (membrane-fusion protein)